MTLFYFDIADHETYTDEIGSDFRDADAARAGAVVFAGDYLKDHPELIWDGRRATVHVRRTDGAVIFSVVMLTVDTPPREPSVASRVKLVTSDGERM